MNVWLVFNSSINYSHCIVVKIWSVDFAMHTEKWVLLNKREAMAVWDRVGPRQSPVKNSEGEGSGFYEWIIKGNQRKCLFESDRVR